jgi:DNA-binding transcriptional LysR family regulator
MQDLHMKIAHLRTFLVVCEQGSFSASAEQVHRSQPAISRQIAQLEQDLGVLLFERSGRRIELTEAGRVLRAESQRLVGDANRVSERMRRFREGEAAHIRVGASSTPAATLVPKALGQLVRERPGLELSVEVGSTAQICARLLANEVDLAVVGSDPLDPSLLATRVARDRIACFRASWTSWDPHASSSPWLVGLPGSATREHALLWLGLIGIAPLRLVELADAHALQELVTQGVGLGCLSAQAARHARATGELVELDLGLPPLWRELYLVHHVDKHLSSPMRRLIELLQDQRTP